MLENAAHSRCASCSKIDDHLGVLAKIRPKPKWFGGSMYSREEKLRAVEPLIKYDLSSQWAIDELGCPCRGSLCN